MNIQLITDSTAYLPEEMVKACGIQVISLGVNFDQQHTNELEMNYADFYQKLAATDQLPTSSQPPVEQFIQQFTTAVNRGDAVIAIFISSDMSGTYSTSMLAREMVLEKNPEAEIHIIDSRTNCMEMGFALLEAATLREMGKKADDIVSSINDFIKRSRFIFVPKTLDYLKKGGRIGGASAFVGSILHILPILTVEEGKTAVLTKVRTQKRAIATITKEMLQDFTQYGCGQVAVHHINDEKAGQLLAKELEKQLNRSIPVIPIGPVIGLHVGPGTVGIAYTTQKNRLV